MAVCIDLGARPRVPRRRVVPGWRRAAAVLGVAAGFTGGAAPARSLDPAVVVRGDSRSAVLIDGATLYVRAGDELVAYRTPGGTRRWTVPAPPGAALLGADGGRVAVAVRDPAGLGTSTLLGVDAVSGAVVWRRTGYVPVVYGCACADGVVVAEWYPPGGDPEAERQRATPHLAGVDVRTGEVRWSLDTPPGGLRRVGLEARRRVSIAVLDAGHTLRRYRPETGTVVASTRLDDPGRIDELSFSGDRLLATVTDRGMVVEATVYDLVSGRRLWRRAAPEGGERLGWCGLLLCARAGDGPTVVLDRDTGRERRRTGDDVVTAWPGGLGAWTAIGATDTGRPLVTVAPAHSSDAALIAVLDAGTGAATVLGRLPPGAAPLECDVEARRLVCRLGGDRVAVWDLAGPAGA